MARERSPNRKKAYDIWVESGGQKKLKDIAKELDISEEQVRKWKNQDKWNSNDDKKSNGNVTKQHAQKKDAAEGKKLAEKENTLAVGLTEKERLFCEVYVRNFNATQAAIKAGYSADSARVLGYRLLTKAYIRDYISALKAEKKAAIFVGQDDIVERYMRIAFADMTDFAEFGRVVVPVMTASGPMMALNPLSGKMEVVMREVNDLRLKESAEVDGGLICQVKMGKDGATIKLEDRQKALDWLANYFEMNPQDKHRRDYDDRRLAIEEKKLELAQHPGGEEPGDQEDDGFIEALSSTAAEDWGDVEE